MPAAFDGAHPSTGPAPTLGQHTSTLLTDRLGLSPDEIARLTDAGTI
jgi:2-methylfumaryl-CoA isomerase